MARCGTGCALGVAASEVRAEHLEVPEIIEVVEPSLSDGLALAFVILEFGVSIWTQCAIFRQNCGLYAMP